MFNTKWGSAGIGFCAQNSLNLLACIFEDKKLKLVYRHKENVEKSKVLTLTIIAMTHIILRYLLKETMLYAA